jgi:hypothetical protein
VAKTLGLSDQTLHSWLKAEVAGGVWDFSLDAYGGALTSFIDLDLKSPEYRIAVSAQKDFSALNPGYVVTNSRRTAERAQAAFHPR